MKYQRWVYAMGLAMLAATAHPRQQQQPMDRSPMPFAPLREPRFVPASKADFLKETDRVVGVSANGVSKAYEPSVLAFHHVVQDTLGNAPVIAGWCSLCNTPLVFSSEVDGKKYTFELAGNRGNNFFMRDLETDSHWQQIGGDCFEGPLKGKRLKMIPFLYTTWGEWRSQHADTLALVPEATYKDAYDFMNRRIASWTFGSNRKPGRDLIREQDNRLANYEQVIGIEAGHAHKAYPVPELKKKAVVNDNVGSTPVLVVYQAEIDTTTAFSRALNGRTLTFHSAAGGKIADNETSSTWNAYGECLAGKLKGQKLEPIIPEPGAWFAWVEFHPDTQVYPSGSQ